ncbi:hypothetical protein [Lactococcus lactis]|uniref:Phage protein n=1 Tax=Lactococcus lactis TaxID=1358 RepID=A0AAW5TPS7_9LACT|nr:hypothetical protein [Lactococcus lactis]MCW2280181.1 hypothetical protein [Lactococcus lactis]
MAKENMAQDFVAMMQSQEKGVPDLQGLPTNPYLDNGEEQNILTGEWEQRPTLNQKAEISVKEKTSHYCLHKTRKEHVKQRNFYLTDSQFELLKEAAVSFGFVRPVKGEKLEPNASAFLQKIIETQLWEVIAEEEGGNHE